MRSELSATRGPRITLRCAFPRVPCSGEKAREDLEHSDGEPWAACTQGPVFTVKVTLMSLAFRVLPVPAQTCLPCRPGPGLRTLRCLDAALPLPPTVSLPPSFKSGLKVHLVQEALHDCHTLSTLLKSLCHLPPGHPVNTALTPAEDRQVSFKACVLFTNMAYHPVCKRFI